MCVSIRMSGTVEGELSVANFIGNFFKGLRGRTKPVACVACTGR